MNKIDCPFCFRSLRYQRLRLHLARNHEAELRACWHGCPTCRTSLLGTSCLFQGDPVDVFLHSSYPDSFLEHLEYCGGAKTHLLRACLNEERE